MCTSYPLDFQLFLFNVRIVCHFTTVNTVQSKYSWTRRMSMHNDSDTVHGVWALYVVPTGISLFIVIPWSLVGR